jgi:hypothetical protein
MANVTIQMRSLTCYKTTESGADEVYVLATGVRSDGATYNARLPGPRAHWDMNDGDQPTDNPRGDSHVITDKTLFTHTLADGQSWELVFLVMEEDGGTTATVQKLGALLLVNSRNPYLVAHGVLLGILTQLGFYKTDTDDYIGSFGVRIMNRGGQFNVQWRPISRVSGERANVDGTGGYSHEFSMNGDGSRYVGRYLFSAK